MLDCQSSMFSLPPEVSYLNCAYMSPLLNEVVQEGEYQVRRKSIPYTIGVPDFYEPVAELKKAFAQLINVSNPDRIAPIPSASYGLATVARNLPTKENFNIVMVEEQFPSNYYIWERLAQEKGGSLRVVKLPDSNRSRSEAWSEALLNAIDDQTVLLALSHVHWADGTPFDLSSLREKTRAHGAWMVLDGTQSIGALPLDVEEIQPDALIAAGYKWLLGPYSLGVAYYGPVFDEGVPIEESWYNREESENFQNLVNYQPNYKGFANRYGVGEQSNFILVPMLTKAIQQLLAWKVEAVQAYCRALSAPVVAQLAEMGCRVEAEAHRAGHLFGVRLPKQMDQTKLQQLFAAHQVFVSVRGNAIRVSPHVYNDEVDMQKFLQCFEQCMQPKFF
ncbi:MAG: aminotransferase class V-fold PLP-dependent enzyme [Cyanothece sp. SIO1E1]|nr:aminotransferase class V-fold PLP-dependent enzyme [Cyanothece sp. SIO1E1]